MASAVCSLGGSGRLTVGVAIPDKPAHAMVTLALAGTADDVETAKPYLSVRTPGAVRGAPVGLGPVIVQSDGGSADAAGSGGHGITAFVDATIDLTGLPTGVAFLDLALAAAAWDWCYGAPPSGAVTLLVDRIDVAQGQAP